MQFTDFVFLDQVSFRRFLNSTSALFLKSSLFDLTTDNTNILYL